jgi:hypothetical protein
MLLLFETPYGKKDLLNKGPFHLQKGHPSIGQPFLV